MEYPQNLKRSQEQWDACLASFDASGKTVSQWCREEEIPEHKLRYRLKKREEMLNASPQEDEEVRWLALENAPADSSGVSLRIGTVAVDVRRGFDPKVLADVLQALLQEC